MGTASADDLASIHVELQDAVAIVHLARPAKRNALNDETVFLLERWFSRPPEQVKAVVLVGDGDHFCAGLDLSELKERSVAEGVLHSRSWHRAFEPIEFGTLPVVAVLHGAVVGGGLRTGRGRAYPRRGSLHLLRASRRQPRHLRRRRRVGARAETRRRRAHDGHDADGPHLRRRRGLRDRPVAIRCAERGGPRTKVSKSRRKSPAMRRSPTSRWYRRCRASPKAGRRQAISSRR